MSAANARTALMTALSAMSPPVSIASTNDKFTPTTGTAYQRADVLFAEPDNSEFGPNYRDQGFLQVTLCYPLNTGFDALMARAEMLRTTFRRGATFIEGDTVVVIQRTPNIMPGQAEGAHWAVPVRITFAASSN